MASFTSSIGTAIYQVLFVVYSYPNDDTEMATFDLRYYSDGRVDDQKLSYPYEPISVYRLNEENPEVTCDPWLASYSFISEHTHVYVLFNAH